MQFKAQEISMIVESMRDADFPRGKRRALINSQVDGYPPYSQKECDDNNIVVNVNSLEATREAHQARSQMTSQFQKSGDYFVCRTDAGPRHKRMGYGSTVTRRLSRKMKRSLEYYDTLRGKFSMLVLHGISPAVFRDADCWCPDDIGIDDVLVPGDTTLKMRNLPFFPIYRKFTGMELIQRAKGPKPDPAWNQPLVDSCLKWIDEQTLSLSSDNWPDYWQPEKWGERVKGDGACYASDRAATVNVWDFYFWNDSKKECGWNRRMILDAWSMPSAAGIRTRLSGGPYDEKDQFLYNPGARKWADKREQIINWQFADLSAVAPFHYHTVRSLGYLLYSVCHLQNRLRCKFNEAVFEQLMVLMRVKSQDDMQRALSVNLVNRGFVDDSIDFIKAQDRYQVNAQLAQMGLMENANLISRNASSFSGKPQSSQDNRVPTATQWMGEEQKITQLVSAGLAQAYEYQKPEYREIFRRFTRKRSLDPDVREFQNECLSDGVPPEVLYNLASWDIEPERVFGGGNKTMEVSIAQWLMENRHNYDPQAQRRILHDSTLAITDDAVRARELVPEEPQVSSSVHDAQLAIGTLLMGQPMELRQNVSHSEYAEALISALEVEIQKVNAIGGVPESGSELLGLQNLAGITIDGQPIPGNGAANHIEIVAQDKEAKQLVKQLSDRLGKAMNEIKAFAQRLQEKVQAEQEAAAQGGGVDAETQAKIVSMQALTEAKAANTRESHAAKTAQRAVQFEREQEQKQQQHGMDMALESERAQLEIATDAAKADIELRKEAMKQEQQAKRPTSSE